jgi:hypothetical protein
MTETVAVTDVAQQAADSNGRAIITARLVRVTRQRGAREFVDRTPPTTRPLRVARMLALAHRLDEAIARGDVRDRASLARQHGFTRARITQILDLTLLAPDIQEEILFMETDRERDPVNEHTLRWVLRGGTWEEQRRRWSEVRGETTAT